MSLCKFFIFLLVSKKGIILFFILSSLTYNMFKLINPFSRPLKKFIISTSTNIKSCYFVFLSVEYKNIFFYLCVSMKLVGVYLTLSTIRNSYFRNSVSHCVWKICMVDVISFYINKRSS